MRLDVVIRTRASRRGCERQAVDGRLEVASMMIPR